MIKKKEIPDNPTWKKNISRSHHQSCPNLIFICTGKTRQITLGVVVYFQMSYSGETKKITLKMLSIRSWTKAFPLYLTLFLLLNILKEHVQSCFLYCDFPVCCISGGLWNTGLVNFESFPFWCQALVQSWSMWDPEIILTLEAETTYVILALGWPFQQTGHSDA